MSADAATPDAGGPPFRVLVVDDEDVMRKAWTRILRPPEFVVESAARANEALAALARAAFDVVVLDVVMPGMTGLEALPEIRRRWPEVRVVMMTAYAGADAAARARAGGVFAFLTKPFESIDVAAAVVRDAARQRRPAGAITPADRDG